MEVFQQQASSVHQLLLQKWTELDDSLTVGFTTRNGGISEQPYHSFNIGLHVNDQPEAVLHNRRVLAESVGFSFDAWTCGEQVHSNVVAIVTKEERGRGSVSMADTLPGVDGIITNERDILLTSFYADCVPLYFWDQDNHVIGLAHAGWKGTVSAIALNMVNTMRADFGTDPQRLRCAIGPAIDGCCYQVNEVVINRIYELWKELELPDDQLELVIKKQNENFALINLKEINRRIMIKAGILASHIEISEMCTGCRTDLFFSHRMENGKTGRMASWIGLRKG